MGKSYVENSLKRFLKRKVKITLGLVVAFMITGAVSFAESTAEEGSTQWHKEQAEKYLEGYSNTKIDTINGKFSISEDRAITIEGLWDNNEKIEIEKMNNIPTLFKNNIVSASKLIDKVYNENGNVKIENIENDLQINGKSNYQYGMELENSGTVNVITGEINKSQSATGTTTALVNKGTISFAGDNGQNISVENGKVYNYGIIKNNNYGQNISGKNSEGYNYGVIMSNNYSQYTNGANSKLYNYGLIINKGHRGQHVAAANVEAYNYGIITVSGSYGQSLQGDKNKAYNYGLIFSKGGNVQNGQGKNTEIYNYGTIKSDGATGQSISGEQSIAYNYGIIENLSIMGQIASDGAKGYNYGIIRNSAQYGQQVKGEKSIIYNYGVIENGNTGGQFIDSTGTAINYGIIKNKGNFAIYNNSNEENNAYNYGVIDFRNNNSNINIFKGNVKNNGIILSDVSNLNSLNLGENKEINNKGVVLDKSFELKNTGAGQINNHVTDLTNSGIIDRSENKTYYVKDKNIEFKNDLTGNVLTAVITSENKNPIFKYTGDNKLVLKNSSIMGYFLASGTLLELEKDKELVLTNSKINTVVGVGSDVADVTAVKLDGGTLTLAGESEIAGKVIGKGATGYISIHNDNQNIALESGNINLTNDDGTYGLSKTNTEVTFNTIKADNLNLDFTVNTNKDVNKVTLNNAELKSIDGSSSTEKIELTLDSTEKVGNITLGQNDDKFTLTNSSHNGIIDMGAGDNDEFNLSMGAVDTTNHHKEAGNTFDYKVNGAEKIVLNGDGWHIGENAELNAGTTTKAGEKTELHIADKGSLHVDMNNNYGAGNVTTSLDKMAEGADLSLSTGTDAEVKFVVGDKFDVSQKQFDVAHSYSVAGANLGTAVIFKGTGTNGAVEEKDGKISLTVKEASEVGLSGYEGIYNAVLKGLSKDDDLRNAVNYQDESKLVSMIKTAGETAEAFYTTGYAVTKDVTDTYMSVVEDFGRKAGKGEWIAYGKYVNSDTEFDGGKSSKGYDGDITGTVGMIEYGVNETTSYGVVYGQGDTEVDIQGGGKLDGDNTYFGGYVKHRTQNGIDLTGNIGITKSELDLSLATNTKTQGGVNHHIITDGNSDADALTFSIKGTKDYKVTDTIRLQPVVSGRYSFISQDEVTSSDANFKMDEQDITIFEGAFGGNIIKDFYIYNGRLSLSAGAEYVLTDVNKDDNARYHLYNEDLHFIGEEDIADNRIEGHIGIDYEHESGVGVDAKYEMIWTDKGDNSRVTAGISYRF